MPDPSKGARRQRSERRTSSALERSPSWMRHSTYSSHSCIVPNLRRGQRGARQLGSSRRHGEERRALQQRRLTSC